MYINVVQAICAIPVTRQCHQTSSHRPIPSRLQRPRTWPVNLNHTHAIMELLHDKPVFTAFLLALTFLLGYFFTKLYHARMLVIRLKRQGLVGPTSSTLRMQLTIILACRAWSQLPIRPPATSEECG